MTLSFRDPTIPDSPLARWDSRWKLAAILVAILVAVLLQHTYTAGVNLLIALSFAFFGRIPLNVILGRAGLLLLSVIPFVIFVPLTQPVNEPGWDWGYVRVSFSGLFLGFGIAVRVLTVGLWVLVLMRTSSLYHILAAAHALRVPGLFVQVAQLAYRYIFVFAAEARRLRIALRTRGFRTRTNRHTYQTLGYSLGSLLVRGGERAERVTDAMRCRGFDGTYRTLVSFRTTSADVLSFLFLLSGTIALLLIDRLFW